MVYRLLRPYLYLPSSSCAKDSAIKHCCARSAVLHNPYIPNKWANDEEDRITPPQVLHYIKRCNAKAGRSQWFGIWASVPAFRLCLVVRSAAKSSVPEHTDLGKRKRQDSDISTVRRGSVEAEPLTAAADYQNLRSLQLGSLHYRWGMWNRY